jgi:hypothetical protein
MVPNSTYYTGKEIEKFSFNSMMVTYTQYSLTIYGMYIVYL